MPISPAPMPCWKTIVANPKLASTLSRLSTIDVSATARLRNTTRSRTKATSMIRPMAMGARPSRTDGQVVVLRGRASHEGVGDGGADLGPHPRHEVHGGLVVDGGGRGDPHHGAAAGRGWRHDPGVGDAGVGRGDLHDLGGLGGGDGDEQRRRGPGAELRHQHVVAVAARLALVHDAGAGHPEAHAERRRGEPEQDQQAGGQGEAGPLQDPAGPAVPAALGPAVVVLLLGDQDAVAEGDEHGGQQGERGDRHRDDREDHAQRHRPEHHDRAR